eukprot:403360950
MRSMAIPSTHLHKMTVKQSKQLKGKLNKLKQLNGSLIIQEIESEKQKFIYDYNHQLMRKKQNGEEMLEDQFDKQIDKMTQASSHRPQTVIVNKQSKNFFQKGRKISSHNDLTKLDNYQSHLDHKNSVSVLIQPNTLVKSLNNNFSSLDEIELSRFLRNKVMLDKKEKSFLEKYVQKGLPQSIRGQDLGRTFATEPYYQRKDIQDSIERILRAYVCRNPTIGYCQGMNFLDAFWLFCMIIETYLPFDYFEMMVGVLIDQKVFMKLVECDYKELYNKFQEMGFDFSILAFQWFVCIFSYNMPEETALSILDYFFLKGNKVLFKVGLSLLQLLHDQIMECQDIAELFQILEPTNSVFKLNKKIINQSISMKMDSKQLKKLRVKYSAEAIEEINQYQTQKNVKNEQMSNLGNLFLMFKSQQKVEENVRLRFLQKFPLFSSDNKFKSTVSESLEVPEKFFHCDHINYPKCIFDFTYNSILPQYFSFKAKESSYKINDKYFYGQNDDGHEIQQNKFRETNYIEKNPFIDESKNSFDIESINTEKMDIIKKKVYDSLIIERNWHPCSFQTFTDKFLDCFTKQFNFEFLTTPLLNTSLQTAQQAQIQLQQYMDFVINFQEELKPISEVDESESSKQDLNNSQSLNKQSNDQFSSPIKLGSLIKDEDVVLHLHSFDDLKQFPKTQSLSNAFNQNEYESDTEYFRISEKYDKTQEIERIDSEPQNELQTWLQKMQNQAQDKVTCRQTVDINNLNTHQNSNLQEQPISQQNNNKIQLTGSNLHRAWSYQVTSIKGDSQNLLQENSKTPAAALINQKSFQIFLSKNDPSKLNEGQQKAIQDSTILAFSNFFM